MDSEAFHEVASTCAASTDYSEEWMLTYPDLFRPSTPCATPLVGHVVRDGIEIELLDWC
jgi:hypothetical protein